MIYLDYAATDPYRVSASNLYGNPNSQHGMGINAHAIVEECRERIKSVLGVESGRIIFGGTTSMLVEMLCARLDRFDYCSPVDHDCFYYDTKIGGRAGFGELKNICPNDIYCHIHTNNITGEIYDLVEVGSKIKENGGYFLLDTTATWGHTDTPKNIEDWCDAVFCSAHKIGGPEGTGFMWVSDSLADFIGLENNSHNEYGLIPGTPAVNNILNMTKKFEYVNSDVFLDNYLPIDFAFLSEFSYWANQYKINHKLLYSTETKSTAINAIWLDGINADAFVQFASANEMYLSSAHSACAEDGDYRVILNSIPNFTKQMASETIRVSFGTQTLAKDGHDLAKMIKEFKEQYC